MHKNKHGESGAGDGNRTHAKSLGSSYSTIELHPPQKEGFHHNASQHKNHPALKSTVLRQGRMTTAQQHALKTGWKQYGIDFETSFHFDTSYSAYTLEIGFGMGDSLFLQAKSHPDTLFIGIEVHKPGIGSLIRKSQHEKLTNIKIFNHEAREVLQRHIPDHTLDTLQIFFPDPWPKKRHHKRRLIQKEFLLLCHQKLKPLGVIHIATDWQEYAEYINTIFLELTPYYQILDSKKAAMHQRPETKFEKRGKKLSHTISDMLYQAI